MIVDKAQYMYYQDIYIVSHQNPSKLHLHTANHIKGETSKQWQTLWLLTKYNKHMYQDNTIPSLASHWI